MVELPFQLLIKPSCSKDKEESLMCTSLLRVIPGRRQVYEAVWNERNVIVKIFSHKINAKRHFKREWRGLGLLQSRELSSPTPLFCGRTENSGWVVVTEKIADSVTVLDAFDQITDLTKKLDLLILVCREIAKEHSKGVLQKDLHLGNFLLVGDKVFALDAGQMRFSSSEVERKKSVSQLALLACSLSEDKTKLIAKLCEEYFKARGWRFAKSDEVSFQKQLIAQRKKGVKKGLKKCLRTSRRHLRIKSGGYLAVFGKGFCQPAELLGFVEQTDAMMGTGQILKDGNTCYVSRVTWNDKDIVVKRYNHKGFIHSLRQTIKRSRARRVWLHAHRLGMLSIATPRPLAYIEKYKGLLVWKSYLVTEYVEGQKLYDFLEDDNVTEQQRSRVAGQIMELLEKLGRYCITHGDLKHSNILITDNGLAITDLDGMRSHRWGWTYKIGRAKDLERLANYDHGCSADFLGRR